VKRLSYFSLLTVFICVQGAFPVHADSTVTRADFLTRAAEHLYGDLSNVGFSAPFQGIPRGDRPAIGLARVLGALQGWDSHWDAIVTRGEALKVLFDLVNRSPGAERIDTYRDVRSKNDRRILKQAMDWNLIDPLSGKFFGWNRAIRESDMDTLLSHFGDRFGLPLTLPSGANVRSNATSDKQNSSSRNSRRNTNGSTRSRGANTIKIGEANSDTGNRSSGSRTIKSYKLPKSDLLEAVWGLVTSQYLYPDRINEDELAYTIAEKVMESLGDKYSTFMRPRSAQSFHQQIQGELSGIGAKVESHASGGVTVVSPLPGSPAMKAGILPGDRITHVNDKSIIDMSFQDGVDQIRGPAGSKAKLTIERGGGKISLDVVRDNIVIPEIVVSRQGDVAIIKIIQFGEKVRRDLTGLLSEVLKEDPSAILIDLRNNPGGLLNAAVDVTAHFLPENAIVARIKSNGIERVEAVRDNTKFIVPEDMPVSVLVNAGSASASEIVAGALKDHGRAKVYGQKTFGKGTVQQVVSFVSGESVKLTIAEWLTPLSRSIEGEGVVPDINIEGDEVGGRDEVLLKTLKLIKKK
jgi:carboxyl-terminal processing protease